MQASDLSNAVAKSFAISSLIKQDTKPDLVLKVSDGQMIVGYYGDAKTSVTIKGDIECKKPRVLKIGAEDLLGVLKGRKKVQVTVEGEEINFSDGKYHVSLTSKDTSVSEYDYNCYGKSIDLSKKEFEEIRSLAKMALTKAQYQEESVMCYILVKKGQVLVSSYTQVQFVVYDGDTNLPDMKLCINPKFLDAVAPYVNGKVEISLDDNVVIIRADNFRSAMPLFATDDSHYTKPYDFIRGIKNAKYECKLSVAELVQAVDNVVTLADNNATELKAGANTLTMGARSSRGTANATVKVKPMCDSKISCQLNSKLLLEILRCTKDLRTATLAVTDNVLLISGQYENGELSAACSLL